MSTLLLRLAAPLQSWGISAKFNRRGTERFPSKSGVIGLIAAAMGRRRDESVEDLCALRFGVRADSEGVLLRDYHTAKNVKLKDDPPYVTPRYYLSDAVFLAGLEGDETLLSEIDWALRNPVFPLYLGRRSCPPEGKVSLGIRYGKTLCEALREEPRQVSEWMSKKSAQAGSMHIMVDAADGDSNVFYQRDFPVSFDQAHRKYGFRRVSNAAPVLLNASRLPAAAHEWHDPMLELEG